MGGNSEHRIDLVPVDEDVLDELVVVAMTDADPDDVTPAMGEGWAPERVAWLRNFHRDVRPGLAGGDQQTWAVRVDGRVVGSIRLRRSSPDSPDVLEYGIWLARSARGRGLSSTLFDRVVALATDAGASRLVARTTATNTPALATLRRAGARMEHRAGDTVIATLSLVPERHSTGP